MAKTTDIITPFGQRFLCKPITPIDTWRGIAIPATAINRATEMEILAVGDGEQDTSFEGTWQPYKVGDIVLVWKWAGSEVDLDDAREPLYTISVTEIIAGIK